VKKDIVKKTSVKKTNVQKNIVNENDAEKITDGDEIKNKKKLYALISLSALIPIFNFFAALKKIKYQTIDQDYREQFPYYDEKVTSTAVFLIVFSIILLFDTIVRSFFIAFIGMAVRYKYFMKGAYIFTLCLVAYILALLLHFF
jgi:hypothetical protein